MSSCDVPHVCTLSWNISWLLLLIYFVLFLCLCVYFCVSVCFLRQGLCGGMNMLGPWEVSLLGGLTGGGVASVERVGGF